MKIKHALTIEVCCPRHRHGVAPKCRRSTSSAVRHHQPPVAPPVLVCLASQFQSAHPQRTPRQVTPSHVHAGFVSSSGVVGHQSGNHTSSGARLRAAATAVDTEAPSQSSEDWRKKARPIKPGSTYPAKELCSHCGLCDTYYVAHVKDACAFLGDGEARCYPWVQHERCHPQCRSKRLKSLLCAGMSKIERLEPVVHGRSRCSFSTTRTHVVSEVSFCLPAVCKLTAVWCRDLDNLDDLHFGIQQEMLYARASPAVPGAQVCTSEGCLELFDWTTQHPAKQADSSVVPGLIAYTLRSGRAS